jgi:hypothetical protein
MGVVILGFVKEERKDGTKGVCGLMGVSPPFFSVHDTTVTHPYQFVLTVPPILLWLSCRFKDQRNVQSKKAIPSSYVGCRSEDTPTK